MQLDRKTKIQLIKAFARAVLSGEVRDFEISHEMDHRCDENNIVKTIPTGIKRISFTLIRSSTAWVNMIEDQKARNMEGSMGNRCRV